MPFGQPDYVGATPQYRGALDVAQSGAPGRAYGFDAAANYPNSLAGAKNYEPEEPYWMRPSAEIGESRAGLQEQIAAQYGAARYGDPDSEAQRALARGETTARGDAGSYAASQMGMNKGGQQAMAGGMQNQISMDAGRARQEILAAEQAQAKQRYADLLKGQRITDIDQFRAAATAYGGDQASRAAAAEAEANRSQNLTQIPIGAFKGAF